jgi:hypothetical protein
MPYRIRKLPNKNLYKVTVIETGQVVAKATKKPKAVISAIEISKHKK